MEGIPEPPVLQIDYVKQFTEADKLQKMNAMDNVKPCAVFTADKITGKGQMSIYCINRRGQKYELVIQDLNLIQFPQPFLNSEICKQLLLDKINEFNYRYKPETDQVEIWKYMIGNEFGIRCFLKRVITEIDWTAKVQHLELLIDQLDPYEIIHEHQYPIWDSMEEFKKLPDYKYFDAVVNYHRYLKRIPGETIVEQHNSLYSYYTVYSFESKGYFVGIYPLNRIRVGKSPTTGTSEYFRPDFDNTLTCVESCEPAPQDRLVKIASEKDPSSILGAFVQNIECIVPCPRKISEYVWRYLKYYFAGWIIVHPELVAFRELFAEVTIKDNKVTMVMKRSKRIRFNHAIIKKSNQNNYYLSAGVKGITSLIIDGEEICYNYQDIETK
jgi:hypothetical protein